MGSTGTLTIGDATAGLSNIALNMPSGMTFAPNAASTISFISTSATQQTVSVNSGYTLGNVTFNSASNGNYAITSAMTSAATSTVTFTKGTLHTDGASDNSALTHSWGIFNISNANTRTLTLGNSSITLTGTSASTLGVGTNTGLTLSTNTATFTLSGTTGGVTTAFNFNFQGASIVMTGGSQQDLSGSGTMTMANFTRTGTATKGIICNLTSNLTCTGTFNCTGQSAINRILFKSSVLGTARTITAATVSVNATDLQDITGAGAGSWDISGASNYTGDCGGNTSITFTTPATQTWSGTSGGNWSTNAWTSRVPLPQDDVVISSAFSASQTVTSDMPRLGKSISWTGATGTPTWTNSTADSIYGSLTLISGMTLSSSAVMNLSGRSSFNITTAGKTLPWAFTITAPSGTYTLQDDYNCSSATAFTLTNGGFNDNGKTVTVNNFNSNNSNTRTLTMTGTWNISSTSATTVWQMGATNLTFTATSSTIQLSQTSTNARTFIFAALSYGTFNYTLAGSTGAMIFQESAAPTFVNFNFSDASNARSLTLPSFFTTTFTGTFNVQGTSGKLMTIKGSTSGTAATISKASGTVSCDYLSIKDSAATGGAGWYAGVNSTDVSGNSGWVFTAPPAGGASITGLMLLGVGS